MIAYKKWVNEQLNELRQWVREFLQGEVSRYVDVVLRQRKADELMSDAHEAIGKRAAELVSQAEAAMDCIYDSSKNISASVSYGPSTNEREHDDLWELAFDLRNRHDALVAHLGLVETEPRLIPSGYRPQVVNAEFITPKKPVRKGR